MLVLKIVAREIVIRVTRVGYEEKGNMSHRQYLQIHPRLLWM